MPKKNRLMVIISSIVLSLAVLSGPVLGASWSRTYGGPSHDSPNSLGRTSDGGYVIAEHTENFGAVGRDCSVLKFDSDGNLEWQKISGGTGNDYCWAIQQTADGGYITSGETTSFGAAGSDVWLMKLTASGSVEWQKRYGGSGNDGGGVVRQTTDLGYIVAAQTSSFGEGSADAWLIKLDSGGNITWEISYGGSAADYAGSLQMVTGGGYIVAGTTSSFGKGRSDAWLMRLDVDGNVTWQKTYGGTGQDSPYAVEGVTGGGYIVLGQTSSFGAGDRDLWLFKIDESGEITWQKTYGGANRNESDGSRVRQTSDLGYIVTGTTASFGAAGYDIWVLKLSNSGNVEWQKRYGGSGDDWGFLLDETGDRGYLMAGGTESFCVGGTDIWLLKLESNGSLTDCPLGKTTSATVTDTTVAGVTSTAEMNTTAATVADTTVTPVDTAISPAQICPAALSVLSPNGSENLTTASDWEISWTPFIRASSFNLSYSLDNGATWESIERGSTGTSTSWTTPLLKKNKAKYLVKVVGLNKKREKVGADKSDGSFKIEVLTITDIH